RARRQRRVVGRRERAEGQLVEAHRAAAADAAVHHQLQVRRAAQDRVRVRSPGPGDVACLVAHRGPARRGFDAGAVDPPHVVAAGVHQLELQVVGRRLAAEQQVEAVVAGQLQRQRAPQPGMAGHALEVVVQAERAAGSALHRPEAGLDLVGGHHGPRARVVEAVEEPRGQDVLRLRLPRRARRQQQSRPPRPLPPRHPPRPPHPFTLPRSSPCMYQRCSPRNSSSTGSTVTTAPAIIISTSMMCSRDSAASATGSVYCAWSASTISGHMKSFQAARKVNTASVSSTGRRSGRTTCTKIRSSPTPSMRAASISASGIERAYWRTRKIPNTPARACSTTPPRWFTSPTAFISRNSGSMATCAGTTSAARSTWNSRSRPRKRSLANAYPAAVLMASDPAVTASETTRLLAKARPMPVRANSAE